MPLWSRYDHLCVKYPRLQSQTTHNTTMISIWSRAGVCLRGQPSPTPQLGRLRYTTRPLVLYTTCPRAHQPMTIPPRKAVNRVPLLRISITPIAVLRVQNPDAPRKSATRLSHWRSKVWTNRRRHASLHPAQLLPPNGRQHWSTTRQSMETNATPRLISTSWTSLTMTRTHPRPRLPVSQKGKDRPWCRPPGSLLRR